MKEKKVRNFIKQAHVVAENSHDTETQVGCIIVDPINYSIISQGYNGFVRGAPDDQLPTTAPEKYKLIMHAEDNALSNANFNSHGTKGGVAIVTISPCIKCLRRLKQAGISEIYFEKKYKDFVENRSMPDLDFLLTKYNDYYRIRFM